MNSFKLLKTLLFVKLTKFYLLPPLKFFDFFHGKLNRLLCSILKSNKGNYYPKMHNAYSPLTFEKRKINI